MKTLKEQLEELVQELWGDIESYQAKIIDIDRAAVRRLEWKDTIRAYRFRIREIEQIIKGL